MDIVDANGEIVGEIAIRVVSSPEDLFGGKAVSGLSACNLEILEDIRAKIPTFPVIEFTTLHIHDKHRRKGYGRRAVERLLREARADGHSYAIVKIGKFSIRDSLENNTSFYVSCGWVRFVTPTRYSLRFAYYDLASLPPV